MADNKPPDAGPSPAKSTSQSPPRIQSADLFRGNRHVVIVHGDDEYRLQRTSNGKLILTK